MPYHSKHSRNYKLKNIALVLFALGVIGIIAWIFYLVVVTPPQAYL